EWQSYWKEHYPCDQPTDVPYPRLPLYGLLQAAARRWPQRPACTLYGKCTTFAQLDEQSRRLAGALAAQGAGPGKHVPLLLPNIRLRPNGSASRPDDDPRHRFDHLVRAEPLAEPAAINPGEDVAVLAPTGGTTASPKAVMLTHRNLVCNAFQLRQLMGGADGA